MNRIRLASPLLLATLALAACGEKTAETSTTKMTNVEVAKGTISDDMILLDTSEGDGTSVEQNSGGGLYETIDNRPKAAAPKAEDKGDAGADSPETPAIQPTTPPTPAPSAAPAAAPAAPDTK